MSTTPTPSDLSPAEAPVAEAERATPSLDKMLGIDVSGQGDTPETESKPEAEPEVKADAAPKEDTAKKLAHEKALMALRGSKLPESIWSKLDADAVIELGSGLEAMRTESESLSRELETLKTAPKAEPKPEPKDPEPLELALGKALKGISEDYPEHAEGMKLAVTKAVEIVESRLQRAFEEKLSTFGLDRMGRDLTNLLMKEARVGLQERFPQLGDAARFKAVVDTMGRLAKSGEYDSYDSLMADAAAIELIDDVRAASKPDLSKAEYKARDKGQPIVNGKTKAADGPTLYERRIARLAEIERASS